MSAWSLRLLVRGYQLWISPVLPRACRFWPSCSAYALEALEVHGAVRGSWLTMRRLLRCHPFCDGGHDPVPDLALNGDAVSQKRREQTHNHYAAASPKAGEAAAPLRSGRAADFATPLDMRGILGE